ILGPLVGFLSGARNLDQFEHSVVAGIIFMLTIGLSSELGTHWISPRLARDGSLSARLIILNVAMRVILTLVAMLVAAALVSLLVFPGYLRDLRSMMATTVYVLAGTAIFTAIGYAARFPERV